jgi:superfamily II DNA or RNA helicase
MLASQIKRRAMLAKSKAKKNKSEKEKEELISTYFTEEYKTNISTVAYLGKKGYTIPKECLRQEDIEFLKADLYVKAETHGPKYGVPGSEDEVAFPVYKENSKKIYIPRFYGIERYGLPEKSDISEGQPISVDFTKELRDYQCKIIDVYLKHVSGEEVNVGGGGILEVPCGAGKTVMALNIISKLKKKTLIIVHKEFLMNQWIDRAKEFIPMAKIGKIQGPIFDVEGKDVVIGMLQTLYDREFPENAFECFGLTIVDEVHRIGSEQFSKTLLRVITKNMLGISATVDRKDGLTKILHMFIGPKIYSEGRKNEDPVCVRAIDYISSDPEFNTVEFDFRGNAKYSTMITKLCDFGPRSDFIIRVLGDLIKENPEKQIMVLCHNRSLLKYLFEAIVYRAFATTGYYVGGMKQKDLQSTEEKQIVLATYAMAAEALDIKTLSTLVMVTPKTDIIQSVGRILRVKHENPIIVDIVDRHDVFQNQFRQRKTFYRKCNYRIVSMDSVRYQGFPEDYMKSWTKVFEPRVFEPRVSVNPKSNDLETDEKVERKCLIQIEDTE